MHRTIFSRSLALPLSLFLLAFLVQVVHLTASRSDPTFYVPVVDSETYLSAAESIAGGDGLPPEPFRYGPLYPYLLAIWYKMAGGDLFLVRLLQSLFTSFGVVLTYLLAHRLFGRTTGVVAGVLHALYWPMIYFSGELLIEPVLIPILLFLLLLLVRGEKAPSRPVSLAAGLVLGLAAVARPNVLLLLPVLFIRDLLRRRSAGALLLAVGCVIAVLPVTLRNIAVGGDTVLVSSTAGINFYMGNNPSATGRAARFPGLTHWSFEKIERIAAEEEGRRLKPSEVSRFYLGKGLSFVVDQPLSFIRLMGKKVVYLLSSYEMPNVKDPNLHRQRSSLLSFPLLPGFGLLFPLAVVGFLWRRRSAAEGPVLLFGAAYAVSVLLFFVNARYRLPILPVLFVYGALGLVHLARRIRSPRSLLPAALIALPVFLLVNWNPLGKKTDNSQAHFYMAWAAQKGGRTALAEEEYGRIPRESPWYAMGLNNRAVLRLSQGRVNDALGDLLDAVAADPTYYEAWDNIGRVYYGAERYAEAAEAFGRAADLWPETPSYHANLGLALKNMDDLEGARDAFREAVRVDETYQTARAHLAEVLLAQGEPVEAREHLERLVREEPENAEYRFLLGRAHFDCGENEEGRQAWEEVLRLAPGTSMADQVRRSLR